MSEKNLDAKGRWRNVTIAFRVSPAENEDINRRVQLSGLTKPESTNVAEKLLGIRKR